MHNNFPRYFIVAKLQHCVLRIPGIQHALQTVSEMFLCLSLRCITSKDGAPAGSKSKTGMNFIRNKKEGVGGQNKKIRLLSVPDAGVYTLFLGLFNNPGRSRSQFYILSTSQHLYQKQCPQSISGYHFRTDSEGRVPATDLATRLLIVPWIFLGDAPDMY